MTRVKPFRCGECGSLVKALKRRGRTREYRRGVLLPVPDDFPIPTCVGCGEEYLSVAEAEALDRLQQPVFVERQKRHCGEVVDRIKATHGVTLRAIEQACGVTGTYLSHVLAGRKRAPRSSTCSKRIRSPSRSFGGGSRGDRGRRHHCRAPQPNATNPLPSWPKLRKRAYANAAAGKRAKEQWFLSRFES